MNFKAPYNLDGYVDFFQSYFLPEDFESCKEKIEINFQTHFIENITKLGEVPSLDLSVYEAKHRSENDPRVSLSRDSFRFLSQYGVKKALILFISKNSSNYRLSLVTIDLKWEEGRRVKKEYSNPRRYSFFLGPDTKTHTPEEYLLKLGRVKDFEDLKNRFSIEVVNKEFYTRIAILFTKLAGGKRTIGRTQFDEKGSLRLPSTSDDTLKKEFSVRLIGRLVFCWFLKKKRSSAGVSLLPERLLSSEVIPKNKAYYHKVLEPLFFEVLNTPIDKRRKEHRNSLWAKIPFLNGGLFTPHIHDFFDPGPLGISKHINTLKIPDEWFEDLFEIFETYNFTIDENTSMDVELAIEPEMLGRIFENLLAEINPETGETARKATGSYYTPRPIVEYMVDESLKHYLLNKAKLREDKIASLLAYEQEQVDLTDSEKDKVLNALDTIKIIDPACGSGAFPIGILQKMLLILQKIDPESRKWLIKKLAQIDNKLLKKELEKKLKQQNWDYVHKLGIIQSSIYGIDIQPIAVDISKLRFFLSLIVDDKVDDSKENRGIEPLPNLEFKFVCANSLVGLPKKEAQQTLFEATDDIDLLKNLRDEYLRSYGEEKEAVEKKFRETQSRMFKHSLNWGVKDSRTLKLCQWDPFSFDSCGWFGPEWMFGVKRGFDIVIANPPYIDSERMVNSGQIALREHIVKTYTMTKGNWDIYIAFFELGFRILNTNGVLTFITPDKWISKPFGDELRKYTIKNIYTIFKAGREIFESSKVDSIISFFKQNCCEKLKIFNFENNQIVFKKELNKKILKPPFALDFLFSNNLDLLIKMGAIPNKIFDSFNCESACATSDAYKLKPLIKELSKNKFDRNKHLKIINTGTIGKYASKWGSQEMTYLKNKYLYPIVNKQDFFNLFKSSYAKKSVGFKIIIKGLTLLDACLDFDGNVIPGKSTLIVAHDDINELKFLLSILNSKLASFFIKEKYQASSYNEGINFTKDMINNLPAPITSKFQKRPFVEIVDKILEIAKSDDYFENTEKQDKVYNYEQQIDKMVYKLYGLADKEIKIVENYDT